MAPDTCARVQALAVGANELHISYASGAVMSGGFFLENVARAHAERVQLPAPMHVLDVALQAGAPGRTGCLLAVGAPCVAVAVSSFTRDVLGCASGRAAPSGSAGVL